MPLVSKYKFLEHPSDIKIEAYGQTLSEVFINAALGMMDYIYGKNQATVENNQQIEVSANDYEALLINWLSEILVLSSVEYSICVSFTIKEFSKDKIVADVGYGKAQALNEIKAVTYHELSLKQTTDGWSATVVYDI